MKRYGQAIFDDFSSAEKDLEGLDEDDLPENEEDADEETDETEFDGTITAPVRSYKVVGKVGVFNPETHSSHNGDDLAAPKGTPVYGIAPGTVSFITREGSGTNAMGGNTVSTTHTINGKTITTYNAHLDTINVGARQDVDQNTQIGTVGNTGNARTTGPHLHFEMRINGSLVEPLDYFGKKLIANKNDRLVRYCDLFYRLTSK